MRFLLLCLALLASTNAFAQKLTDRSNLEQRLKQHVYVLAADSMEGRNTGTEGERKAIRYITAQYKSIGLTPKGNDGFEQPFMFNNGMRYTAASSLMIDGVVLKQDDEFFPLSGSRSGVLMKEPATFVQYGIVAPEAQRNDYQNVSPAVFVVYTGGTDSMNNPHGPLHRYTELNFKIKTAVEHGAKAVIFINPDTAQQDDLEKDFSRNGAAVSVPVLFVRSAAAKKLKLDDGKPHLVTMTINVEPVKREGRNVVAMIDNPGTDRVVVIGAHYDHLGLGHDGNSLHSGEKNQIHNGADDNASGTAAVIELARLLKQSKLKNNDYLFINFSAEELGLIGSKHFVENATVDTSKINYMINMDMIGRYQPEKGIEISGLGTSPEAFAFIPTYSFSGIKIKAGQQGTGPTDHTSFYHANIPVLNFFTGTHEDYHKPSDDADKVNYADMTTVVRMIYSIVDSLDNNGTLPFTRTAQTNTGAAPSFKVRMGIMPDYMFEGPGVRIDGTTDGLPAHQAGLQKGDVILEIDSFPLSDVMSYMHALAKYKKGDNVQVKYKRADKEQTTSLQF